MSEEQPPLSQKQPKPVNTRCVPGTGHGAFSAVLNPPMRIWGTERLLPLSHITWTTSQKWDTNPGQSGFPARALGYFATPTAHLLTVPFASTHVPKPSITGALPVSGALTHADELSFISSKRWVLSLHRTLFFWHWLFSAFFSLVQVNASYHKNTIYKIWSVLRMLLFLDSLVSVLESENQ